MSQGDGRNDSRVQELLAGRVLGDLVDDESRELDRLMTGVDFGSDIEDLEIAAAAVQVAFAGKQRLSLPEGLRARCLADASRALGGQLPIGDVTSEGRPTDLSASPASDSPALDSSIGRREVFAWVALAATVMLAIGLWVSGSPDALAPTSAGEARLALIDRATDLVRVDWGAGKTPFPSQVEGDVVWSTSEQKGFMRFVGMPVNDPTVEQYQLWIIDPNRDSEPVDGGVFDVNADGEVIVPIDAKLAVVDPAAFAITIEQPGGVVVSTQERLPLLAAVN